MTVTQSDTDVEISVKVTFIEIGDDGEEFRISRTSVPPIAGTIDMDGVVTIEEGSSLFYGYEDECGPSYYPPESAAASFKDGVLRVEVVVTTSDCGKVTSTLEVDHKLRPV